MKLKEIIIGSILIVTLCGCPARPKYPMYLTSLTSKQFYTKSSFCKSSDEYCKDELEKIDYGDVGDMIGYGMSRVTFYYKSESCPLFSYTQDQLLQMKRDSGYKDNSFDGVFLVESQGLRFVSNKEFKNLRANTKSAVIDEKVICKLDAKSK